MKSINLPDAELTGMRQFYQEELEKTLRKLQHIKSVLEQLGDTSQSIEISVSGKSFAPSATIAPLGTKAPAKVSKRKYRKKAGRKAMWGPVILKRMAQINRPLTYDELTDEIMEFSHLGPDKRSNTKAAIVNVTFRLRTKEKKINTFSNGSREKYLALNAWFDETGEIKQEFRNKLPKVAPKVVKPKGKRGRPSLATVASAKVTPKKRGRPASATVASAKVLTAKVQTAKRVSAKLVSTPKKRGRPALATVASAKVTPKKRGRPALATVASAKVTPKKRGRPALATVASAKVTKVQTAKVQTAKRVSAKVTKVKTATPVVAKTAVSNIVAAVKTAKPALATVAKAKVTPKKRGRPASGTVASAKVTKVKVAKPTPKVSTVAKVAAKPAAKAAPKKAAATKIVSKKVTPKAPISRLVKTTLAAVAKSKVAKGSKAKK